MLTTLLSYPVAVTHNSTRPAPSAATHKSHPVTRLLAPPKSKILIANPRLEIPPTHSKQNPLTFSNREYIALFQFSSRRESKNRARPLTRVTPGLPTRNAGVPRVPCVPDASTGPPLSTFAFSAPFFGRASLAASLPAVAGILPLLLTHGRASRSAGTAASALALSPLITHRPAVAKPPHRFLSLTSHKLPVTSHDFLSYGPAIRNPRKP